MNIAVLDGYTMNPGDLSWDELKNLGNVTIYDRTPVEEVKERIVYAEIVLTNKAIINAEAITYARNLKYIGVMATGFNVVDIQAAQKKNITVTNVPSYSTVSVAQMTFALILELTNHVAEYAQSVQNGDWVRSKDFSYQVKPIRELQEKTLGIIGLGRTGKKVARIGQAFGMKVIASHKHPERDKMEGVQFVHEEICFRESDILSLHCPLNEQNKGFINKHSLTWMKSSALLINTSRGPLINEQDLADALNNGRIAGAGLDVLSTEPPSEENPLLYAKNCIVIPHIAWATYESRQRLMKTVVDNIRAFTNGKPENVVI
ncbi:MAG: D-2-hydroxyacid dehydrogenase [Chitinophagaceae bacterium]|nr:MAG: D-2-hydroxyacid dehydrogenase [Chitinophagaceae bacterium]